MATRSPHVVRPPRLPDGGPRTSCLGTEAAVWSPTPPLCPPHPPGGTSPALRFAPRVGLVPPGLPHFGVPPTSSGSASSRIRAPRLRPTPWALPTNAPDERRLTARAGIEHRRSRGQVGR